MARPAKYSWLDDMRTAFRQAYVTIDWDAVQPTSNFALHPLFAGERIGFLGRIFEARKEQDLPYEELGRVADGPSFLRAQMCFLGWDVKTAGIRREQRLELFDFFHGLLLSCVKTGDAFAVRGANVRHTPEEVAEIIGKGFQEGGVDAGRALGKMHNAAYNHAAALWMDFYMDKAMENYGAYPLGKGKILVIKDFHALKPNYLWPKRDIAADRIVCYAVYEGLKFHTKGISAHSTYDGNPVTCLTGWRLEKDGREVTSFDDIAAITENLAGHASERWQYLTQLPEGGLINEGILTSCALCKGLCDKLGLDWKPPETMLEAAKGKTLAQGKATWKKQNDLDYLEGILDPRTEEYP